jgi:4-hydroxy-tetrahydrodipicolinate synthase
MIISGLHTAIVTPFTSTGALDIDAFRRLLDLQLAADVDGIVVCGSTGEGATLSTEEKVTLWRTAVEHVGGRVPITAGTGTNDTRSTVSLSLAARDAGANALLVVTPYYNKPTPSGLVAHYRAINDAVDLPIIVYNVPGRTGQNVSAATQVAIATACPNAVATKEASANLSQMSEIIRDAPSHFTLLAGDDDLALPAIACGATGVIAVMSNYLPRVYGALIRAALSGDLATARAIQNHLRPFYTANFLESNPIPVKYLLHKLGHIDLSYRLPLVPPTDATRAALDAIASTINDAWKP